MMCVYYIEDGHIICYNKSYNKWGVFIIKVSVNIKMDEEIRNQSKILFSQMGLDMTTAVNMFLIQAIREKSIPFKISTVNKDSV